MEDARCATDGIWQFGHASREAGLGYLEVDG